MGNSTRSISRGPGRKAAVVGGPSGGREESGYPLPKPNAYNWLRWEWENSSQGLPFPSVIVINVKSFV